MTRTPRSSEAQGLLAALRQAGSDCFLDEGDLMVSPPLRRVDWPGDIQDAIEAHYEGLRALVRAEQPTIH